MLPDFYFEHLCKLTPGVTAEELERSFDSQISLLRVESIVRLRLESNLFIFAKNQRQWLALHEASARILRKLDWIYEHRA